MSYNFDSRLGEHLYRLLPEVYRTRDRYEYKSGASRDEDLARYLDAHGYLLDLVHSTLEQRLRDSLPTSSQDWLLPYFAQLLAVNIVSPDVRGRQAEVGNAVSWRQRKGTLKVAEQIAEVVGQMEAEIQEGWKRVAMTPRIGMPLIPVTAVDDTLEIDDAVPAQAARHPSLPAAMIDLRRPSRAVEALATNPAAKTSNFGGEKQNWRQLNYHGAPCFPGSYEDVSRRTVDIRNVSAEHGRYHHKRLLAYVPPPDGLIPFAPLEIAWSDRKNSLYEHLIEETVNNEITIIRNQSQCVVVITDDVSLDAGNYKIEGICFQGELKVADGGKLELLNVEAGRVDVDTHSTDEPVVTASKSLIGVLSTGGVVQLDSCTVRDQALIPALQARDCILMDIADTGDSGVSGVIEYSYYPALAPFDKDNITIEDSSTEEPAFFTNQRALNARSVLAPITPASIYLGASDGGEMGYFHHGREGRPIRLIDPFTDSDALQLPADNGYILRDLIFEDAVVVNSGRLALQRCAISSLTLPTDLPDDHEDCAIPLLEAQDCLFDTIEVSAGLARLEYCTVMRAADCKCLQASDCIFAGTIGNGAGAEPESGCIRYSRIPAGFDGSSLNTSVGHASTNTSAKPEFIRTDYCGDDSYQQRVADFGDPGYAVLDRCSADAIRFGAEDGAEMGGHHNKYFSLKIEAVLEKMREFLPVGIEAVIIEDQRLLQMPPELEIINNGGSS